MAMIFSAAASFLEDEKKKTAMTCQIEKKFIYYKIYHYKIYYYKVYYYKIIYYKIYILS